MFTIEFIEEKYVKLIFQNDQIKVLLIPMAPENILDLPTNADFEKSPCNGFFGIQWTNSDFINLECSNYNDEEGGELSVSIPKTPENLASLKECFDTWRAYFAEASLNESSSQE